MNKYEADKQAAPQRVLLPEAVLPYCFNTAAVLAIQENIPTAGPTNFGEYWGEYGMSCRGNEFNTAKNKQKTEEIIKRHKENGEPLRLVTIVCPPYEMEDLCSRNNKGLFSDINDDPLSHNFMYSYKLLAYCLAQTADFIESQGVKTQMTWVIGDWALRDSRKDEQRYDANPVRTISTLDSFAASTQAYFDDYFGKGRIEVERFMNTEITDIYPMTMPQTAQQKKEWVMENIAYIQNLLEQSDNSKDFAQALPMIIDLYNSMGAKIVELADSSKWASLELEKKNLKKVAIKFFQVLKNTIASRKSEKQCEELGAEEIDAGFWDAIIKAQEYVVYGRIISNRYPDHLSPYFDTKYPAAGLFFEEGGLNLLYLDSRKYLVPMSRLGVMFSPY